MVYIKLKIVFIFLIAVYVLCSVDAVASAMEVHLNI